MEKKSQESWKTYEKGAKMDKKGGREEKGEKGASNKTEDIIKLST